MVSPAGEPAYSWLRRMPQIASLLDERLRGGGPQMHPDASEGGASSVSGTTGVVLWATLLPLHDMWKRQGKTVVWTNG